MYKNFPIRAPINQPKYFVLQFNVQSSGHIIIENEEIIGKGSYFCWLGFVMRFVYEAANIKGNNFDKALQLLFKR